MPTYKCIPAPKELIIYRRDDNASALEAFADLINSEATDGWHFHSLESITVTQRLGCLGLFLRGSTKKTEILYMLIFEKPD